MPEDTPIPRILAINDVNLTADNGVTTEIKEFYSELIGLEPVPTEPESGLRFRGYPRSGPQLIVTFTDEPIEQLPRRQALIQVGSLAEYADEFIDRKIEMAWSNGWFYFDRRLTVTDPAGNLIELMTLHSL